MYSLNSDIIFMQLYKMVAVGGIRKCGPEMRRRYGVVSSVESCGDPEGRTSLCSTQSLTAPKNYTA